MVLLVKLMVDAKNSSSYTQRSVSHLVQIFLIALPVAVATILSLSYLLRRVGLWRPHWRGIAGLEAETLFPIFLTFSLNHSFLRSSSSYPHLVCEVTEKRCGQFCQSFPQDGCC